MGASRRHLIGLVLVLALALVVRLGAMEAHSSRTWDEILSMYTAIGGFPEDASYSEIKFWEKNSLSNVVSHTIEKDNGNALAYHFVLHFWTNLFGFGILPASLLSIVFSLGTVWLGAVLAKKMFNSELAGLLAGLLIALQPSLATFGVITRAYSMGTFLTLLGTWLFLKLVDPDKDAPGRSFVYFGVVAWLTLMTHYLSVYLYAFQGFYFLARNGLRSRRTARFVCTWVVVFALLFIWAKVLAPSGVDGMQNINEDYWITRIKEGRAKSFYQLTTLSSLVWSNLFWATHSVGYESYWTLVASHKVRYLILPLLLYGSLALGMLVISLKDKAARTPLIFASLMAVSSAAFANSAAVMAGHNVSFLLQYMTFGLPFVSILTAGLVVTQAKKSRTAVALLLGLAVALSLSKFALSPLPETDNKYPLVAQSILRLYQEGDVVLYPTLDDSLFTRIYLKALAPAGVSIEQRVEASAVFPESIAIQKSGGDTLTVEPIDSKTDTGDLDRG